MLLKQLQYTKIWLRGFLIFFIRKRVHEDLIFS